MRTIRAIFILLLFLAGNRYFAQTAKNTSKPASKPKLIVGIVIDQMRNDYIYRFWDKYGNGGFKRMINKGFYLKNAHFDYVPTYTGPGHACIYTGTTPRTNGIIANEWFDRQTKKMTYCVDDKNVNSVGTLSDEGKKSPLNLLSSTVGDELKMSTNNRSKVFAIALKDRSAVLPAGHSADAAFWYDDSTGYFVSSSWYTNSLPKWLNEFNASQLPKVYLQKGWNTLKSIESYTNSISDQNNYEKATNKKEEPTFPYDYSKFISKNSFGILKATPYGNTITKDLAIACLKNEKLGKDEFADLLAISFSSSDIIAHSYGPRSVEMEDVYIRLDVELEELLKAMDAEVGDGNYVVFLTADHGGADVSSHLKDEQIPADYLSTKELNKQLRNYFQINYNDSGMFVNCSNDQIFLDEAKLAKHNKTDVEQKLCDYLVGKDGIAEAYPSGVIKNNGFDKRDIRSLIQNGYNHQKSGNVAFVLRPAWMDYTKTGTTHGTVYSYDTHVPLIFYGCGIKEGSSLNYYSITQIAPTLSDILRINYPNGCMDNSIDKLLIKEK